MSLELDKAFSKGILRKLTSETNVDWKPPTGKKWLILSGSARGSDGEYSAIFINPTDPKTANQDVMIGIYIESVGVTGCLPVFGGNSVTSFAWQPIIINDTGVISVAAGSTLALTLLVLEW